MKISVRKKIRRKNTSLKVKSSWASIKIWCRVHFWIPGTVALHSMHHNLSTSQCKDIIFVCVIFFVVDSVHSGEAQTCTNGFRENEIHIYPVAFILFIYFIEFFVVVVGFFLKVFGSLFVASRCSHIFVVGNFSCCCFFLAAFKDFFIRWKKDLSSGLLLLLSTCVVL